VLSADISTSFESNARFGVIQANVHT